MRTIIELLPAADGRVLACLKSTSIKVKRPWVSEEMSLDAIAPVDSSEDWVRLRGASLLKSFASVKAVETALRGAMLMQGVHPIYLRTVSEEAELLDWEMLYDDDAAQFLSLQGSWPIGRLTNAEFLDRPPEPFPASLRLMAIFGALGQDATLDWRHLQAEVVRARATGLQIEFVVLTGQESLEGEILAAGGLLRPVPEKPDELARAIREFNPHVLHFFCHGSPNMGAPFLEIATANTFASEDAADALHVTLDYLRDALVSSAVWLLVLNCCSGAETGDAGPGADNRSLARQLAEEAQVPAAIGMAAPISPADAAEFTRSFYPLFFEHARKIITEAAHNPIDWATLLVPVRKALSLGKDPMDQREWALPIVYALEPVFTPSFAQRSIPLPPPPVPLPGPSFGPPPDIVTEEPATAEPQFVLRPAHLITLQWAAKAMRELPIPEEAAKRKILAEMLAGIPEEFWPDTNGNFRAAEEHQ